VTGPVFQATGRSEFEDDLRLGGSGWDFSDICGRAKT
jgi:hypothetical protein